MATTQASAGRAAADSAGRGSLPGSHSACPAEIHPCACTHSAVLHGIPRGKTVRTACSFTGPRGVPCGCAKFTEGTGDG